MSSPLSSNDRTLLGRTADLLQLGASSDERGRLRREIEAFLSATPETAAPRVLAPLWAGDGPGVTCDPAPHAARGSMPNGKWGVLCTVHGFTEHRTDCPACAREEPSPKKSASLAIEGTQPTGSVSLTGFPNTHKEETP